MLAAGLFTSFASPQVFQLGRGLRLALPLFAGLVAVALAQRGMRTLRTLQAHATAPFFGLLFVGSAWLRYLIDPVPEFLGSEVIGVLMCLGLWLAVLLVRSVFTEALEPTRWVVLLVVGISLGVGIPILLSEPGIARRTMGPEARYYSSILLPIGVGNFSWYTPVACAWPALATWLAGQEVPILLRAAGWCSLLAASVSVLLSTFTMAAAFLVIAVILWLVLTAGVGRGRLWRLMSVALLGGIFYYSPRIYSLSQKIGGTAFETAKAENILEGVSTEGLVAGDETGRGWRLAETMKTFLRDPIAGAWGFEKSYFIGGHSSWIDLLGREGVVGVFLLLGFLGPTWSRAGGHWRDSGSAAGGTLSWALLVVGGFMNPIMTSQLALLLIWLFDNRGGWPQEARRQQPPSRVLVYGCHTKHPGRQDAENWRYEQAQGGSERTAPDRVAALPDSAGRTYGAGVKSAPLATTDGPRRG